MTKRTPAGQVYLDYMHWSGVRWKHDDKELVARWYAAQRGWSGSAGGWIYHTEDGHTGRPIVQGYRNLFAQYRDAIRDAVTKHLTAFTSFQALVGAVGYRPTLLFSQERGDYLYRFLATEYNMVQASRGDPRRSDSPDPKEA